MYNNKIVSNIKSIEKAVINLKLEDILIENGLLSNNPSKYLTERIEKLILGEDHSPGFSVLYGLLPIYMNNNIGFNDAVIMAKGFFKNTFYIVTQNLSKKYPESINPFSVKLGYHYYDLEGYGANKDFQPYDFLKPREAFHTIKCIHFDSAESIISNIYGPNKNIKGGFPVLADVRSYCKHYNVNIRDILTRMENDEPVTMKNPHYDIILKNYTIAFDLDMENDVPCVIVFNEPITGGIAHAAMPVDKFSQTEEASRPLHHMTFAYDQSEDVERWYEEMQVDQKPIYSQELIKKELFYYKQNTLNQIRSVLVHARNGEIVVEPNELLTIEENIASNETFNS